MSIELPPLPWPDNALAPHISGETIEYHYGKHHRGYVTQLNKLIEGTSLQRSSLEEIVKASEGPTFNNAAQVWNHTFYWSSLKPGGGGEPSGPLAAAVRDSFGGYAQFREAFLHAAESRFGSGWTWLVAAGGKLAIETTANADTPLTSDKKPLLTVDVWEHAYYIDYRNARAKYLQAVLDKLLNWDFALRNWER